MSRDEQAIRDLIASWLSATQAGDVDQVLRLMTDDVVFLSSGQPPMRGKATFAANQSKLQPYRIEASSEIQEIQVFGDWAYSWTRLTVVITPKAGGAPIKRAGDTLSILRKQSGNWAIFRDANLLAADG